LAVSISPGQAKSRPTSAPAPAELASELEEVFRKNLEASVKEDLGALMATLHPKSPAYAATRITTGRLFKAYDLKYELISFKYICKDGVYALARVKQKTTKTSGPAFLDNLVDAIHVLRKDGQDWKIWQSAVLEVTYLSDGGTSKIDRALRKLRKDGPF